MNYFIVSDHTPYYPIVVVYLQVEAEAGYCVYKLREYKARQFGFAFVFLRDTLLGCFTFFYTYLFILLRLTQIFSIRLVSCLHTMLVYIGWTLHRTAKIVARLVWNPNVTLEDAWLLQFSRYTCTHAFLSKTRGPFICGNAVSA